jgi:hypothetical protein
VSADLIVGLALLFLLAVAAVAIYRLLRDPTSFLYIVVAVAKAYCINAKPYDAETQKRYDDVLKQGGEWDHIRKKERER